MRVIPDNINCEVKRGFYAAMLQAGALPWDDFYVSRDQSEIMSPAGIERIRQNIEGTVALLNRQQAVYRDAHGNCADAWRIRFNSETGAVEIDEEMGLVNLSFEQSLFRAKKGNFSDLEFTYDPSWVDQPRS